MPRHISFFLTTRQFGDGTKDVTRRLGWAALREGAILEAVEKAQGLKKGEKVRRLGRIRVTSVGREPLGRLTDDLAYGREECRREGFPRMTPAEFVAFFCSTHRGCTPETAVTRIAFERVP
jgi:hypothetical protein